ncbi:lymphocyte antigen 75-like [Centroberyx affinis]|uniref:lymphocyte antigen 75-like n=1 Tax=Centroberyx affinis TaxID=166261 RepID=UPI003A5BD76F
MAVKKNSTFRLLSLFLLITTLCAESFVPLRRFLFVNKKSSWTKAQHYCRKYYTDLATIRNQDETGALLNLIKNGGWIGLYRKTPKSDWSWSGGEAADVTQWEVENNDTGRNCVFNFNEKGKLWRAKNCMTAQPFFCHDEEMFLVKEKRSWEEALEHCRSTAATVIRGPPYVRPRRSRLYDLASLASGWDRHRAQDLIQEALTDQIWSGLRFLGDRWLWVSGQRKKSRQLPLCPAWWQRCGSLHRNNSIHWEARSCREKRNFLCSRRAQ